MPFFVFIKIPNRFSKPSEKEIRLASEGIQILSELE